MTWCQRSDEIDSNGVSSVMAALLTRMSRRPHVDTAAATARAMPDWSETSVFVACAVSPSFRRSAAAASTTSWSRSHIRTRAPSPASRRAAAKPMPRAAPVTSATLSWSRPVIASLRVQAEVGAFGQGLAAIHDDRCARDVFGVVGGEEQHGVGDVARRAEAAERDHVRHRLDEGGAAALLHAFGQDVAGFHAIDRDAVAGELECRRLDEAVDAGLAGRIVAVAGTGHARTGDRGGEHHAAVLLRFHRRQRRARGEIGALEIDAEHMVPLRGLDVLDQGPGIDAGILHQDVEPAMP